MTISTSDHSCSVESARGARGDGLGPDGLLVGTAQVMHLPLPVLPRWLEGVRSTPWVVRTMIRSGANDRDRARLERRTAINGGATGVVRSWGESEGCRSRGRVPLRRCAAYLYSSTHVLFVKGWWRGISKERGRRGSIAEGATFYRSN